MRHVLAVPRKTGRENILKKKNQEQSKTENSENIDIGSRH